MENNFDAEKDMSFINTHGYLIREEIPRLFGCGRSFAIATLGCKVNQGESASIAALMEAKGWQQVNFDESADVYIINTCTVTHLADKKSRAMIRRAISAAPQALVVAVGCYAQVNQEEIAAIGGVGLIVGVDQRRDLAELIEMKLDANIARYDNYYFPRETPYVVVENILTPHSFVEMPLKTDEKRARAYLKIADGCNQFCHYCIVPYARGPMRSLEPQRIMAGASKLIKQGYGEIVLTGVHIGAYGQDLPPAPNGGKIDLPLLLVSLLKLPGLGRIHLSSIEPYQFSDRLLFLLKKDSMSLNPQICPHLHIPLQSGSDKTLKAMGRKYSQRDYAALLKRLRDFLPNASITTDVMVGYPGELKEDFRETYEFCKNMEFADLHVFQFSPRKKTKAADLPAQVSPDIKAERSAALLKLAEVLNQKYGKKFIGRPLEMLTESKTSFGGRDYWYGHSENYLGLLLPLEEKKRDNSFPREDEFINVIGKLWKNGCLIVESTKRR
jgi:threonylcarbamoyladenosine tRNA methylthiotransferase MtaB